MGLSCDDYIKTFNTLMMLEGLFIPLEYISTKGFNNSYVFKKSGTLSTMSFLKGRNKLSRLVFFGFNHKDLRANPFEEGEFDA